MRIKRCTNFGGAVVSVLREDNEIAGTVSGIEAAIHCGDELWFRVSMEVILCALTSVVEMLSPLPTVQRMLQYRSSCGTRALQNVVVQGCQKCKHTRTEQNC